MDYVQVLSDINTDICHQLLNVRSKTNITNLNSLQLERFIEKVEF